MLSIFKWLLPRQIREELWELNDSETCNVVGDDRSGKNKPVPFDQIQSDIK